MGTTEDPMFRVMPGAHKPRSQPWCGSTGGGDDGGERFLRRRDTRTDTRPDTCLRKKMAVGNTALASRDIINSQRMAICLDEPREAQYMAGFIALQMSKMWGMFEGGEKRARSKGSKAALTRTTSRSTPNGELRSDQEGILLPSRY